MAELLMMLGLLSVTVNKAMTFLLRCLGFGLNGQSKKAVLLQQALLSKNAPWPDLPPELLGLVLLRMPSHADRIRLSAVCRQWRSAARLQPLPPLLPWLALRDDNFFSLPDGAVHRMPLPGDISYRLSTGTLLFLVRRDGSCCLMNPFSREITPQQINPDALELDFCFYGSDLVCKVVVSDHIVALLTRGKMNNKNVNIFTRGPPHGAGSCSNMVMEWAPPAKCYVADIALFQGKLYVLTAKHDQGRRQPPELHALDVSNDRTSICRSIQCIRSTAPPDPYPTAECCFFYLVECRDRLLMVERKVDLDPTDFAPTGIHIKIWEAMDLSSGSGSGGWWSKVDTLMGHALFVSPGCSESLRACGGSAGAREDCVYFTTERISNLYRERKPEDDFLDCIVYDMRDRTVVPLPLETEAALSGAGPWHPTWVFPD